MKIKHLIYLLTVILFSACVNDNFSSDDKTMSGDDENQTYYICIDLKSPQTPYTRNENNSEEDKFDNNFEDGNENESAVGSVRFYFFDGEGKAVKVRNVNGSSGSDYSYAYEVNNMEVIPDRDEKNNTDKKNNLEETVKVVLSIQFENGHKPSQVIAILNPNAAIEKILEIKQNTGILKLSDLQTINTNFLKDNTDNTDNADLTSEGNFVMSNSTYVVYENSGEPAEGQNINQGVVCAAHISETNIRTTEEEAKGNPVDVYVERVLAKLEVSFRKLNMTVREEGNYFLFKLADKSFIPVGEETKAVMEIYVKFLGYALTSTPKKSYLLKNVDENWDHTSFFTPTISWTAPEYSRSYWAINPQMDVAEYQWFSFEDLTEKKDPQGQLTNEMEDGCFLFNLNPDKKSVIAYMQENANPNNEELKNPDYHTKAIFAAQLVKKNGDPITMAEYESKKYTLDGLKNSVANSLDLWTEIVDGEDLSDVNDKTIDTGEKRYRKIKPEDLDFETATAHGVVDPELNKKEGTYFVYFTLKKMDDQENERYWYHESSLSKDTDESLRVRNIKAYIDNHTFPAKIWNDGMTYYFFDIVHCEDVESKDSPGYFGVVRNTLYSATIDELTSFGTPVYNPAEMIYPENPASEGNQLKVTIESVKWRLVNQDLQLAW
ncbi:MAG: fimbria major subunit [Muribaculaceae bacterium]|nr:fimbria major subunit [Muribaculaceae bacterium]